MKSEEQYINFYKIDPYEAARKLLALLELDPSRATENSMESVRKFAKNRSMLTITPSITFLPLLC